MCVCIYVFLIVYMYFQICKVYVEIVIFMKEFL